nr:enhanced ethylene response protein 5 [Tanacetum cinerariifolium]
MVVVSGDDGKMVIAGGGDDGDDGGSNDGDDGRGGVAGIRLEVAEEAPENWDQLDLLSEYKWNFKNLEADQKLSCALTHCDPRSKANIRIILKYLVPVKLSIGILPKRSLLEKHNLAEYSNIVLAMRRGDLRLLRHALEEHEDRFLRSGVYLILKKLELQVYQLLVKKIKVVFTTSYMYTKYAEMAGFEIKKEGQRLTKSGEVQHKYIYCNKEGVPKGVCYTLLSRNSFGRDVIMLSDLIGGLLVSDVLLMGTFKDEVGREEFCWCRLKEMCVDAYGNILMLSDEISGLYTSRLLDAACKKVLNLLKKCTRETFNCYKGPYDLSYVVLIIRGYSGKTSGCTSSDTRGK